MPPKAGEEAPDDDGPWPGDIWLYHDAPTPPPLELDYEPPGFVGTLLGPDGEPLVDVYEPRPPFGFHRP